ncbi:MAG: membrane protein insertase YidC [Acidimicrobiia bacterium]
MFGLFARILEKLYEVWPSYFGAIALLTLIVMIVLTPLTLKGTRSMMMLQLVQPEVKRLQNQYRDDRQKLNEAMLQFYKENNINPFSGCLPLLVQFPVFIVLYRVLHGLTRIDGGPGGSGNFNPSYISDDSALSIALRNTNEMLSFGIDLSKSAAERIQESFVAGLPYLVLVLLVGVTSFVQQKQISGRNPALSQNPQQRLLMKLAPAMITFFSLIVPAGLTVYFLVSNLYRIMQQELISRTIYRTPEAVRLREMQETQLAESKTKPDGPKKGFMERYLGDAAPRMEEVQARKAEIQARKAKSSSSSRSGAKPGRPANRSQGERARPSRPGPSNNGRPRAAKGGRKQSSASTSSSSSSSRTGSSTGSANQPAAGKRGRDRAAGDETTTAGPTPTSSNGPSTPAKNRPSGPRPATARSGHGGRTTPPGARPQNARKKKKRK